VSKAHDESSRQAAAEAAAAVVTPAPELAPTDDAAAVKQLPAAARRVRTAVPRERSGPIGIASGDFATPSVRRRTITQPRGTPIIGVPKEVDAPLSAPIPPPSSTLPTPPPLPREATSMGATPVDLVEARSVDRTPPPPPASIDSPFAEPESAGGELDTEAAVLAAEAAAVRALDSGPLTPLPEVVSAAPTPPPVAPPAVIHPLPEVARVNDLTPPPQPREAIVAFKPPHLPATPAPDVAGALPVRPMGSDGSAASADLSAAAVATPAPTGDGDGGGDANGGGDADAEVPVDELEVLDGKDGPSAIETVADASSVESQETPRPVSTTRPPPPPIPGSYLKTPGPEPRPTPPPAIEGERVPPMPPLPPLPVLPALPVLPEALSLRPRRPKRSKPWFEEVFDEDYLRTLPFMRADQTLREVEFISSALETPAGAEILDVGCGYGRHAIELVQRGYSVTGLDLSLPLLIRAADEAQRRGLAVNFVHADMREMSFEKQFAGAYSMLTSFGYFDEETNLRVAERIGRALKPGGRLLLDVLNRDYVVADLPVRVWWEGTGCVVLEEVDFNFHTSRINTHRSIVFEDGRQVEQELSVRAYSLHEIGRLLRQAGFRVIDVSGGLATRGQFFGASSRSLLILAEKRDEEA
jgi:SAM-dependent methyltransferase